MNGRAVRGRAIWPVKSSCRVSGMVVSDSKAKAIRRHRYKEKLFVIPQCNSFARLLIICGGFRSQDCSYGKYS